MERGEKQTLFNLRKNMFVAFNFQLVKSQSIWLVTLDLFYVFDLMKTRNFSSFPRLLFCIKYFDHNSNTSEYS